jgi:Ca2+-binding RTX toxin-like protein
MFKFFKSRPAAKARKVRKTRQTRRLGFQSLEGRELMAGITYNASTDTVTIDGGSGRDVAEVERLTGNRVKVTLGSQSRIFDQDFASEKVSLIRFNGNAGNDLFSNYTSIRSIAHGGSGTDSLYGGAGRDDLYGDGDRDYLWGNGGGDYLYGGSGNDDLYGGSGNDVLVGQSGNDLLNGGDHDDRYVFNGSSLGRDTIESTAGVNTIDLRGRGGSNTLDLASTGWQTVKADNLYLKLSSSAAVDNVYGSNYRDVVYGNHLNNYLSGHGGNDSLYGNGGNDTLRGDAGTDYLKGGAGTDKFPEATVKSWTLTDSLPGWNSSDYYGHDVSAPSGYYIVSGVWRETSAIRGSSAGPIINSARSKATVMIDLRPEQFGSGGARVEGKLTLTLAPIGGDTLIQ